MLEGLTPGQRTRAEAIGERMDDNAAYVAELETYAFEQAYQVALYEIMGGGE